MIYLLIFIFILTAILVFDFDDSQRKWAFEFYILIWFSLFIVAAIRYRMAPDTVWYMAYFDIEVVPVSFLDVPYLRNARYQILWTLLASLCKSLGGYFVFQFVVSGITCLSFSYFIKQSTEKVFTATMGFYLLCYHYFTMDILREALAIGMFLISVVCLAKKRRLISFCFAIAAYGFHNYAVLLLPILILNYFRVGFRRFLWYALIGVGYLFYIQDPLVQFNSFFENSNADSILAYQIDVRLTFMGYLYQFLKIAPVVFLLRIGIKKGWPNIHLSYNLLFNGCVVYCAVILIRTFLVPYAERYANYFVLFPIILFSGVIFGGFGYLKSRFLRFGAAIFLSLCVGGFSLMPMLAVHSDYGVVVLKRYYPFYTIFSEKTDDEREQIIRGEAKE